MKKNIKTKYTHYSIVKISSDISGRRVLMKKFSYPGLSKIDAVQRRFNNTGSTYEDLGDSVIKAYFGFYNASFLVE